MARRSNLSFDWRPFIYLKIDGDKKGVADIMLTIAVILCLIFYFVVSRIKIYIDNDGIALKTILATNSLKWEQVRSSKLSFEVHAHSGDIKWLITDKNDVGLGISLTWFSKKDNQVIAEALVSKCEMAKISDKVNNMSMGKFPWYVL